MVRREVEIPIELIDEISEIVNREGYKILQERFPINVEPPIFLSKEEADALITLAVIEKKKARLKYPYYDDHPNYNEEDEYNFNDVQMGIYEKTIYYVESAFKKGEFDELIRS